MLWRTEAAVTIPEYVNMTQLLLCLHDGTSFLSYKKGMKDAYHHESGKQYLKAGANLTLEMACSSKLAQTYSTRIVVRQGSQYLSRGGVEVRAGVGEEMLCSLASTKTCSSMSQ